MTVIISLKTMYKKLIFIFVTIFISNIAFASNSKFMEEINNLAENGYVDAQYNLARIYSNGESVDQDLKLASYWFLRAAEQGNRDAQYQLARMFESGLGVTVDPMRHLNGTSFPQSKEV